MRVLLILALCNALNLVKSQCGTFDGFDSMVTLDPNYDAYYTVAADSLGVYFLHMKLVGRFAGWMATAISPDGKMIGSDAVIALPGGSVASYDLTAKAPEAIIVRDLQDLQDYSMTTDATTGTTTTVFSRPLVSNTGGVSIVPGGVTNMLFSYSLADVTLIAKHDFRVSMPLTLAVCVPTATAAPTVEATMAPSMAPTFGPTAAPTISPSIAPTMSPAM